MLYVQVCSGILDFQSNQRSSFTTIQYLTVQGQPVCDDAWGIEDAHVACRLGVALFIEADILEYTTAQTNSEAGIYY